MANRHQVQAHAGLVLVGLFLCAAFALMNGIARASIMVLASAIPAGVVLARITHRRTRPSVPWHFLAAALIALTLQGFADLIDVADPGATHVGGFSDTALLIGYVLLLGAAVGILAPLARSDGGALLEASALWLAGASVLWVAAVHPALVRADVAPGEHLYLLVVVLVVSAVTGQVLQATISNAPARPALVYMTTAAVLMLAGNVLEIMTRSPDGRSAAWWLGFVWISGYAALAAAAVHPSHRALTETPPPRRARLSLTRLVVFGLALGLNPVLTAVQEAAGVRVDWMLLAVASLAIVTLVVVRIADLTRRQAAAEHALTYLATHDELTGLANRRAALSHLGHAVERLADPTSTGLRLMFLDVDALKAINDTHGHSAGDAVIRTVGRRLVDSIPPSAFAARFGGDEFLVIDERPTTRAADQVDSLRAALSGCHVLDDVRLPTSVSIGVVDLAAGASVGLAQLVADADAQMYADKRDRVRTS